MIGFLVSHKTLNGQEVLNRRYPDFAIIPSLLEASQAYTFNTIHYNSRQLEDLGDQIKGIFVGQIYNDSLSRGVQLNIPWPPAEELTKTKRSLPELKIIMQLSKSALENLNPIEVSERVLRYGNLVDYVLIDPSGGRGLEFDPYKIVKYYTELRARCPDLTIGLAGGFTGENVIERCKKLIELTGETAFSIDAEGGLRDKLSANYGDDLFNFQKAEDYIKNAEEVFS
jgi:hypothetical protein